MKSSQPRRSPQRRGMARRTWAALVALVLALSQALGAIAGAAIVGLLFGSFKNLGGNAVQAQFAVFSFNSASTGKVCLAN